MPCCRHALRRPCCTQAEDAHVLWLSRYSAGRVGRYEVEATVLKNYAPEVDAHGELYVKEGQRVLLLRRISVERNGRQWLYVCDTRSRKSAGLVPEDLLEIQHAHTHLW